MDYKTRLWLGFVLFVMVVVVLAATVFLMVADLAGQMP